MRSPGPIETPAEYLNIGTFRFWFVGERWEWSDEVARMHGYEPGDVEPTTQLLLSHKRPRRRARRPVHDAIVVADRTRQEVLDDMATLPAPAAAVQSQFDHLLLTVHERISPEPAA